MQQTNIQFDEFRAIGDYINEGIILYDLRTETVIYANSAVTELLGIKENASASQIMSLLEEVILEDQEYLKNQFRQFTKKKAISNVRIQAEARTERSAHMLQCICALRSL